MSDLLNIFISSTREDLADYRLAVRDAILEMGHYPSSMEHWPVQDTGAIEVCKHKVESADIYIGIYAYRYGWKPENYDKSITEMEYDWATEKGIPRLCFIVKDNFPWADNQRDNPQDKIIAFKKRLKERIVGFFTTPDNLKAKVIVSLYHTLGTITAPNPDQAREQAESALRTAEANRASYKMIDKLRFVGDLPRRWDDRPFHDRYVQQAKIANSIQSDHGVITVSGRAGVGKTGLVCKVLSDLEKSDDAPDGMVYFSFGTFVTEHPTLERVIQAFSQILPDEFQLEQIYTDPTLAVAEKATLLLNALQGGRYVLLLDNLETIQDDDHNITDDGLSILIETVLKIPSPLTIVVTTRQPLNLPSLLKAREVRIILDEGLEIPEALEMLRTDDVSDLLPLEDEPLYKLISLTRGFPRALEAVMGLLASRPTLALEELLEDQTLFSGEVTVHIVQAAIDSLPPTFKRTMEALAVYGQSVPLEALEYLLAPYMDTSSLRLILDRLVEAHFVTYNRITKRYTLHSLDRDYALSLIPDDVSTGTILDPVYNYHTLNIRAANYYRNQRLPDNQWTNLQSLEPVLNEIEYRMRSGDYITAADLIVRASLFLLKWGEYDLIINLSERVYGRKLRDNSESRKILLLLGFAYNTTGRTHEAIQLYETGIKSASEDNNKPILAQWNLGLGGLYSLQYKYDLALQCFQRALSISREIGEVEREIEILQEFAYTYYRRGEDDLAIHHYEQSLAFAQRVNNRKREGVALRGIGECQVSIGYIEQAIETYKMSLKIAEEIQDHTDIVRLYNFMGYAYRLLGQFSRAIELQQQAFTIDAKSGHAQKGYSGNMYLTGTYYSQGDMCRALEACQQALEVHRKKNNKIWQLNSLSWMATIFYQLGQLDEAVLLINQTLEIALEGEFLGDMYFGLYTLSRIQALQGDLSGALESARKSTILADQIKSRNAIANSSKQLAWVLIWNDQFADATHAAQKAINVNRLEYNKYAFSVLGVALSRLNRHEEARSTFEEALSQINNMQGDIEQRWDVLYLRAFVYAAISLYDATKIEQAKSDYLKAKLICAEPGLLQQERLYLLALITEKTKNQIQPLLSILS